MTHTIGYARVSTHDQNPGTQQAALEAAGCDRVFTDHGESSRKRTRPQWMACLDYAREGDTIVVYRLDRIAGSTGHLIEVVNDLGERGLNLRSLTEPEIDTTTPMGRALYGMVAVFAQLRVDTIRQNTRDGLARARAEGRVGGRPTVMTPERIAEALRMRDDGKKPGAIAATLGVGRSSVLRAFERVDEEARIALEPVAGAA
ncbi:DNA invertase Pin-like site-specific DNA recombinase [Curtobacterium sp. AG1037]|uniref:recombinase family protein n=1 Tax=Curtobacterium sp. AG1037 TaxID=2183990 RepID=UPI000E0B27D1|nr:recombinase family protein [Curtobacterium sp. AG1037]RDH95073.1 DNA invertase Pin-like site-specific DNA recombinase [Curtobacterium sp. AG1037]